MKEFRTIIKRPLAGQTWTDLCYFASTANHYLPIQINFPEIIRTRNLKSLPLRPMWSKHESSGPLMIVNNSETVVQLDNLQKYQIMFWAPFHNFVNNLNIILIFMLRIQIPTCRQSTANKRDQFDWLMLIGQWKLPNEAFFCSIAIIWRCD